MTSPTDSTKRTQDPHTSDVVIWLRNSLTKRELFAAMAMQGALSSGDDIKDAVRRGIESADKLLAALSDDPSP